MTRFRLAVAAGSVAVALSAGVLTGPATAAPPVPLPGAPGIGDPLYPTLGNGGYDVTHYSIDMSYRADTGTVDAAVVVRAVTTQALTRFDLDFEGNVIRQVQLDGAPVAYLRQGSELIVMPRRPLRQGQRFAVRVTYLADPAGDYDCAAPPPLTGSAWLPTPGGFVIAGQPNCAHTVFPSNDHPRDKASYDFTLRTPAGLTAVASGSLVRKATAAGRTVWTYREDAPMATELVQIAVGPYTVLRRPGPGGVQIRDVVPTSELAVIAPKLVASEGEQLRWMQARVGRYPFGVYGVLPAQLQIGFALETQTLSLFPDRLYTDPAFPESIWSPIQLHELAHQWFGDDITPEKWADVWLNEGHATWYEGTYAEDRGWASFTDRMRAAYAAGDQFRHDYGPVASPPADNLFNPNVYDGGALVLYALRQRIGTAAFDRLERAWIRTYGGSAAGTLEFIALASRVSGHDQSAFLTRWLYGTTTPPMPGHPDWTVDPVGTAPTTTLSDALLIRR